MYLCCICAIMTFVNNSPKILLRYSYVAQYNNNIYNHNTVSTGYGSVPNLSSKGIFLEINE